MPVNALLDERHTAKYILLWGGQQVRFVHYADMVQFLNEELGRDAWRLSVEHADDVL